LYIPVVARFASVDPLRFKADDINLFRYCKNNPTNKFDPSGTKVFVVGRPEPWVRTPLGEHYSIVVVSDDGTKFITYDGAGPIRDFCQDKDERWIPQRNLPATVKRVENLRDPKTGKLDLKTEPNKYIFEVDTGDKKTFEEQVRAIEYVFQNNIWQLPYALTGPNSNTYANALLGLAGCKVKPYKKLVECYEPPPLFPGHRFTPQYETIETSVPLGGVGWDYTGHYGVVPQRIPPSFQPSIASLMSQAGPSFQKPVTPPLGTPDNRLPVEYGSPP
jgi:hypothetical protein